MHPIDWLGLQVYIWCDVECCTLKRSEKRSLAFVGLSARNVPRRLGGIGIEREQDVHYHVRLIALRGDCFRSRRGGWSTSPHSRCLKSVSGWRRRSRDAVHSDSVAGYITQEITRYVLRRQRRVGSSSCRQANRDGGGSRQQTRRCMSAAADGVDHDARGCSRGGLAHASGDGGISRRAGSKAKAHSSHVEKTLETPDLTLSDYDSRDTRHRSQ